MPKLTGDEWVCDVAYRKRRLGVSLADIAKEAGYSVAYTCTVVTGKQLSPKARDRIDRALRRLEKAHKLRADD